MYSKLSNVVLVIVNIPESQILDSFQKLFIILKNCDLNFS